MSQPNTTFLAGRRALVTGASRGVGRSVARALAGAGVQCLLTGRDQGGLDETISHLAGAAHASVTADLGRVEEAAATLVARVESFGGCDILVHCAGVAKASPVKRFDLNAARLMYEVNVLSLAWLAQSLLPAMQERGWGRVVAVGSTCSLHGYPYVAGYAASKHALAGWVRSAAREVAASGVTVNVLCPGYLDTEMTAATIAGIVASTGKNPADVRKTLESLSPQQRIFSPDEVASTALFLCSDGARGVNGQAIAICGGENT